MGGIFHPDSKLMRLLTFVTNLVCLNLLWIVSCIPIITAGAATTAMYSVLFSYLTQKEDAVLKPFLRAFRDNFRRVTPAWLLHILVAAVLIAGVFYMTLGVPILVKVIFGLALFFYAAASSYCYPLFARYDATRRETLFNSFALTFRHLFNSFCLVAVNSLPVALVVIAPQYFWQMSMVWTMIGFSLSAWLNAMILLTVFRQYEKKEEEE
jgi:uncharacterized membrane protein YesL